MKFSVVIPTYNASAFLAETLQSVSGQTFAVHEIIIVDDGSIDGTSDLVRALNPKAKLIQQSRTGVCGARNAGASAASGDIVAFLDHDDVWQPWAVEVYASLFDRYSEAVAVGGGGETFSDGAVPWIEKSKSETVKIFDAKRVCLESSFVTPSSLAVKKNAFATSGGFQERAIKEGGSEDWDICFRLGKLGALIKTSRKVVALRLHSSNTSKTMQYNNLLRYTCNHVNCTRYWMLKCHELGMEPKDIRAMLANRYMNRHLDLCDQGFFWSSIPWLIRSIVNRPQKLDSLNYVAPHIRLKRLMVLPKIFFSRLMVGKRRE
jgi:glycosyltransferase involved in cell wall biosynthesis